MGIFLNLLLSQMFNQTCKTMFMYSIHLNISLQDYRQSRWQAEDNFLGQGGPTVQHAEAIMTISIMS